MSYHHLTQTLVNSFNALADEFQNLTDRKTILEHKLRFAHEQFQYLADKYAPAAPEITDTLAKLQVPPELHHPALEYINFVPLPKRHRSESQHQIALLIREGRKVAQRLSISSDPSKDSGSTRNVTSPTTLTTLSTAMEQDFTIQGKKGNLGCPFQPDKPAQRDQDRVTNINHTEDPTPHHSADPICAAMYEETMSSLPPMTNPAAAQKCPIRYMDQHSPEEIAQYVEKHKHEIPRSHEVCLSRYQRSEDQIRKLDAKYGSLVAMIQDLSHLHKPMLPLAGDKRQAEVDRASNQRVENWAQDVSATEMEDPDKPANVPTSDGDGQSRESHFDRPLKEVRVGESPSRPWGISVPVFDTSSIPGQPNGRPESPPPAPVMMPPGGSHTQPNNDTPKCPFGHRKINARMDEPPSSPPPKAEDRSSIGLPRYDQEPLSPNFARRVASPSPAFINPLPTSTKAPGNNPQMLFTGPVFIGYPIDQAIQFMQHFQSNH